MLQDKDIPDLDDERTPEDSSPATADDTPASSLKSQMSELVEDVRILAHAEIEYYRTKLSVNLAATKRVLVLFGLAIIVGAMAVIALILGLLLIVSSYLGPLAATGIVTGTALVIAWVTMGMAVRRAKRLPLDEKDARNL